MTIWGSTLTDPFWEEFCLPGQQTKLHLLPCMSIWGSTFTNPFWEEFRLPGKQQEVMKVVQMAEKIAIPYTLQLMTS